MKVAFQGEHGAYSELAAVQHFSGHIETIPCKNFSDVFGVVERGEADYGIVPVENSLEGSIGQNYDLLLKSNLKPVGETILRVHHCLIAKPGTELNSIKRVYSHPQALGQCRIFLERNNMEAMPAYDTAGSVKDIKDSDEKDVAAIASELAAKLYNMEIIERGIESDKNNFTRFLIISRDGSIQTGNDKTSVIFTVKHEAGSLFRALKAFADSKINLTKLESRPTIGKPWEYNFYLDFEGHISEEKVKNAIEELKNNSTFVKIFGSYPRSRQNVI